MLNKIKTFPYLGAVSVTYTAMFFEGALNVAIVAIMVLLSKHLHQDIAKISLLVSAKGIGTMLSLYASGSLSDRYGRKKIILLGALGFAVFIVGLLLSSNYTLALFFAFMAGVGHGLMDAPAMSLLFDAFPGNTGPAMSIVQIFFAGGGVLTTLFASFLIANNLPWQFLFYVYLVFLVFFMVMIMKAHFPVRETSKAVKRKTIVYEIKPKVIREGLMLAFSVLLFALANSVMMTWLPTYASTMKGMSDGSAVRLLTSFQIGAVLGAFVFAWILRKTHTTVLMVNNPLVAALMLLGIILVNNAWLLSVFVFIYGSMMGVYFSLSINMGGELFYEKAGTATGAVGTIMMLGTTISVALSGFILEWLGVSALFIIAAVCMFSLVVMASVFRKNYLRLKPRIEVI